MAAAVATPLPPAQISGTEKPHKKSQSSRSAARALAAASISNGGAGDDAHALQKSMEVDEPITFDTESKDVVATPAQPAMGETRPTQTFKKVSHPPRSQAQQSDKAKIDEIGTLLTSIVSTLKAQGVSLSGHDSQLRFVPIKVSDDNPNLPFMSFVTVLFEGHLKLASTAINRRDYDLALTSLKDALEVRPECADQFLGNARGIVQRLIGDIHAFKSTAAHQVDDEDEEYLNQMRHHVRTGGTEALHAAIGEPFVSSFGTHGSSQKRARTNKSGTPGYMTYEQPADYPVSTSVGMFDPFANSPYDRE